MTTATAAIPGAPTFTQIPKRTGGTRIITHLASGEGSRYARLVGRVACRVDGGLAPGVATDRHLGGRLESLALARRRFRAALHRLQRPGLVLAQVDVRDCFPSIAPQMVERSLRELGCRPFEVLPVRRFLEDLADAGARGLPVGPRSSGILANAVLRQIDHPLERQGIPFARWVDDVFLAAPDTRRADEIVETIAEALAALGMRLNHAKTVVGPPPPGRLARVLVSASSTCEGSGTGSDERMPETS